MSIRKIYLSRAMSLRILIHFLESPWPGNVVAFTFILTFLTPRSEPALFITFTG